MILGKIIGGFFGYLLAGPVGGMLGLWIGHHFDRGVKLHHTTWRYGHNPAQQARIQKLFFDTTFAVMGHVAKADGRVSEREIEAARSIMRSLNLTQQQTEEAIHWFNQGKSPNFKLDNALASLTQACHNNHNLLQMFVEIQVKTAFADGTPGSYKMNLLNHVISRLGFSPTDFAPGRYQYTGYQHSQKPSYNQYSANQRLREAYSTLAINEKANPHDIKKAYRKLMSQHHPDKLVSKGLPQEMIKLATERTQQIKEAYETVKQARGFS